MKFIVFCLFITTVSHAQPQKGNGTFSLSVVSVQNSINRTISQFEKILPAYLENTWERDTLSANDFFYTGADTIFYKKVFWLNPTTDKSNFVTVLYTSSTQKIVSIEFSIEENEIGKNKLERFIKQFDVAGYKIDVFTTQTREILSGVKDVFLYFKNSSKGICVELMSMMFSGFSWHVKFRYGIRWRFPQFYQKEPD